MSFGGRLAQFRAIRTWNPERRACSSDEEFDWGKGSGLGDVPKQVQSKKHARRESARLSLWQLCEVVFDKAVHGIKD
jgi:hypothetical protein